MHNNNNTLALWQIANKFTDKELRNIDSQSTLSLRKTLEKSAAISKRIDELKRTTKK